MDLAEKTPCVVFESPPKPAHSIDALLLFADHTITHSSLRKILAVHPLNEGQKTADFVGKVEFSGSVALSLALSENLFTTVKWLFGPSLTVAALSVG